MVPRRRLLASLASAVLVLCLTACGGGSDDDAADGGRADRSTTGDDAASTDGDVGVSTDGDSDEAAPPSDGEAEDADEPLEDPYDGHSSKVYDDGAAWICRPDLDDDVCRDLDVTELGVDGTRTVEEREPAADPPVDCFYIYPTVSSDPGINSDRQFGPEDNEARTVVAQAAQYARSCRVFAPVYRQVTLAGLGSGGFAEGGPVAYEDVLDAWKTYISQFSDGRGVVLIGHSQGAGLLSRLLAEEVDGDPAVRERLVAAHLFGTSVEVPEGAEVGGTFEAIGACATPDEVGCVVTWSSYPATTPPVENAIFGGAGDDGQRSLCVDAVALLGRERATAVAPTQAPLVGGIEGTDELETQFVALPDALEVACESTDGYDYLAVGLADEADPRPVAGLVTETLGPTWGLHLVDMTVALDDLVELAARQGAAFVG